MTIRATSLMAVLAMTVAACGQSSAAEVPSVADTDTSIPGDVASLGGETEGQASEEVEVDAEAAMLEFAQCLRDQGFDVEDPTVDADGNVRPPRLGGGGGLGTGQNIDREAMQEAREACSDLIEGVSFGFQEVDQTALQDQLVEFAACAREQGLDVDDPDFSEGGFGGRGILGDLDRNDPEVAAALDACSDILGAFGFGAGGGPGRNQGGN